MSSTQKQRSRQDESQRVVEVSEPTGLAPFQQQFGQDYSNLQNLFRERVAAPLTLEQAPIFSSAQDPIVQNMISQGIQNIKAGTSTNNAQMSNALNVAGAGDNSALLNALNRQSQFNQAGAINSLIPQGAEIQRGFDLQRQQAIQARNQAELARRGQLVSELGQGANLLQILNQMAELSRGNRSQRLATSTMESGSSGSRSYV